MAADRSYIVEHMWVKMVAENIAAIGISEKMSALLDKIYTLYLPSEGDELKKNGFFAYAEGGKLSTEFVVPISGTVLQINYEIWPDPELTVNNDPYVSGWWLTLDLSNPDELNELLTPEEYRDLNAKVVE